MGLQTVTWLVAGELVHHDSLGSVQLIRPGQLNLMTAGHGIAHAEESTGQYDGDLHGIQLWVAQPDATRNAAPAFEHHADLPQLELDRAVVTVLVGAIGETVSPARRDTDHLGAELALGPGQTTVPVDRRHEHALIVLSGSALAGDTLVEPGHLAYLGLDRDEIALTTTADARAILLGGVPFPDPIFMWWNFVARDAAEIDAARAQWQAEEARFGTVRSRLDRIAAPTPVWATAS
jgi:hypothetical protein